VDAGKSTLTGNILKELK
jgi:peptide chain release factor subunit 3